MRVWGNIVESRRALDCFLRMPSSHWALCVRRWRNISAGWLHTCGITADGTLYCWGNNRDGQVGRGDLVEGSITCEDEFDKCVAKFKGKWALREFGGVQAGKTHTCGIKCADNPPRDIMYQDIFCQNGSKPCSFPEPIPSTCTQGKVVCWGGDDFEQVSGTLPSSQPMDYRVEGLGPRIVLLRDQHCGHEFPKPMPVSKSASRLVGLRCF